MTGVIDRQDSAIDHSDGLLFRQSWFSRGIRRHRREVHQCVPEEWPC